MKPVPGFASLTRATGLERPKDRFVSDFLTRKQSGLRRGEPEAAVDAGPLARCGQAWELGLVAWVSRSEPGISSSFDNAFPR